ncbi:MULTISPECIES: hypothetical protein [unclassified Variovorax]|uniref:hypothetical protein n=1 Tax=unclassified Variovorax TaxID=663243 RepID=UPI0008383531|nr:MULTISPECIES: hypothetical protein [unclassified Variovorax]PNG51656.1 hypothetical protein CHC06_05237 [Variovorax sp. B2]PNG54318.1 hypothetical protein CHC07_04147 [Variovorax sp. B4]VTV11808.1 hypothetical protein WDL1CHR_02666 [Variovorax sp. WDL1]
MCLRTNAHPPAHTRDRVTSSPSPAEKESALDQAQSLDRTGLWPCRRIRNFLLAQQPARGAALK